MEAAWLAAVIVVPVFFNIYSSRIFEPDKMALLRTLALVALAAWLVKLLDQGGLSVEQLPGEGPAWRRLLRVPLAAPVLGVTLVLLVSALLKRGLEAYSRTPEGALYTFGWIRDLDKPDVVVPCPMHEEPLHLVPTPLRPMILEQLNADRPKDSYTVQIEGEMCPFCRQEFSELSDRYGHIQEAIVQPFHPKADTKMRGAPTPAEDDAAAAADEGESPAAS